MTGAQWTAALQLNSQEKPNNSMVLALKTVITANPGDLDTEILKILFYYGIKNVTDNGGGMVFVIPGLVVHQNADVQTLFGLISTWGTGS
jgi:hypothetical protein